MMPSPEGSAATAVAGTEDPGAADRGAAGSLSDGGTTELLIRAKDWSATPLGPIESWSPSLRMMVGFLLANRFPLLLWWGPDYISIYNDAYRPILGTKHPAALGQPVRECWSEIWPTLQPLIDTPFGGGPSTWMEDLPLEINRHGFLEETHFTVAYSPVPDETAPRGIGGVLATVHEVTEKIVGERRVLALRDLSLRAGESRTAEAACAIAAEVLARHGWDIPFALLYLLDADGGQARLCGAAGIGPGQAASPPAIDLAETGRRTIWPLAEVVRSEAMTEIADLADRFGEVPPGPWPDPPHQAVIVPIHSNREHVLAGFFVAGVSPRLRLDHLYRSFFELVAAQIATAIANARAYEEERRRAEALAEIDRAKTAFFSNVSHEFRTPLTLLLGPLEDALNDTSSTALPALQRERLDVAHRNSLRLLRLVNTLLDFSRIEAGRAEARYQPTDLAALTIDLASGFRSAIERAGLFLKMDCPALPEPVLIDRDMWEKVVLNLLSNAFKFTFAGGITVTLRAGGGHAAMMVADTGVGIPRHELPRIFERFHRVEGQKSRSFQGSGIGLALVHDLVRQHGGTIVATSDPGAGSAFTVTIPLGTAHLPESRIATATALTSTTTHVEAFVEEALRWLPEPDTNGIAPAQAPASAQRARVLLADDNADMRGYVRRLLRDRYDVTAVADGQAALAAIRAQRPDLVLADVMMPGLDGFALLHAIRDDPALRDLPVVLLSARAGDEARAEGLDAGADDYLTKPFTARELLARLNANLEMARVRRDVAQAAMDSAERLRQMFEQAPGFMCILRGPDHVFELANAAYMRLTGHREAIGRTVREAFPEVEGQGFFERLDEVYRTGMAFAGQGTRIVLRRAEDGSSEEKFVDFVFQPITEAGGAATGIFVEGSDVTERVRAEMALHAAKEQLEEHVAQRTTELRQTVSQLHNEVLEREQAEEALRHAQKMEAIGQLTGGVAHDFNNMLQAILGGLEIAQRRIAEGRPKGAERFLNAAQQAAEAAAGLTRRLLAFARRQRLEPASVDPDALVTGMAELIRRSVGAAIQVELQLGAAGTVWCDPNGLESALLNLCINSRDAMPKGGRLTIGTHAKHLTGWDVVGQEGIGPGDYVAITVADTGQGMPPDIAARAFEPFFTTKPQGQGTGLGLSQVFGFVRQSGGLVRLHSTPGQGTTVELCLPAKAPTTPQ